jgi:hypothetical protein
MASNTDPRIL